jgi:hypothetical protein
MKNFIDFLMRLFLVASIVIGEFLGNYIAKHNLIPSNWNGTPLVAYILIPFVCFISATIIVAPYILLSEISSQLEIMNHNTYVLHELENKKGSPKKEPLGIKEE